MKSKNFLPAAIAGGVVHFLLGWLIYGMLLSDYMKSPVTGVDRTEMLIWSLAVGSFLISYILISLANVTSVGSGAMTGFLIGLLFAGSIDFIMYGTSNVVSNLTVLCIDVATVAVITAIVGAVVAAIGGMGKKTVSV
ncbi:hypothetical protein BH11BAC6_BH11BAC6_15580 [soil metagenome]